MAIRHKSPVLVIVWPNGRVEVTQVSAKHIQQLAKKRGATVVEIAQVQSNVPESLR